MGCENTLGGLKRRAVRLAVIDFPIAFSMESHLEEAVLRIMAFAAAGTDHVAAPGGSVAIVIFGDGEGGAATAGDQEHSEWARSHAGVNGLAFGQSSRAGSPRHTATLLA